MSYKVPIHPRRGWIRAGLSRVRRIDKHGKLLAFHSHEQHRYIQGKSEPRYAMPAIRHQVQPMRSSLGFRMFTVVYEIPEENAWRILGWDALMHWQ